VGMCTVVWLILAVASAITVHCTAVTPEEHVGGFSVAQPSYSVGGVIGDSESYSACHSVQQAQAQCLQTPECTSVLRFDGPSGTPCARMSAAARAERASSYDPTTGVPTIWIRTSALEAKSFDAASMRDLKGLVFPNCTRNQYLMPHTGTCHPCMPGSSCEEYCVYTCLPCAIGTFNAAAGGSCEPCTQGTYQPNVGATACLTCSAPKKSNSDIGAFYCAQRPTIELHGARGPRGPRGVQGEKGLTGAAGRPGPEGPQGPRGWIGLDGLQGAEGNTGPQGEDAKFLSQPSGVYTTTGGHGMLLWFTTLCTVICGVASLRVSFVYARSQNHVEGRGEYKKAV